MRTFLKFIGLIDLNDNVHGVELETGLNIITGRSSTGKSSIIEIFDFCFGSSEDTIPLGIIKNNAAFFFLWIKINSVEYLIGRSSDGVDYYIIDHVEINDIYELSSSTFDKNVLKREDFILYLGLLFGIDAENTAETIEQSEDKRKAGRPSVRNMMPLILQHQNLIANKQALFYRFDQKEKREQTINQFKVFAGIVDAHYYSLSVEVAKLSDKIEKLKKVLAKSEQDIENSYNKLIDDIQLYTQITGNKVLGDLTLDSLKADPDSYKNEIENLDYFDIKIAPENKTQLDEFNRLEKEENRLMAELRAAQIQLEEVNNSIEYIEEYKRSLEQTKYPESVELKYSVCPFCHQHTSHVDREAQSLFDAINNLNNELKGLTPIIRPLHEDRISLNETIDLLKQRLDDVYTKKDDMEDILVQLRANISLQKQAYKALFRMLSRIELVSKEDIDSIQKKINALDEQLYFKKKDLDKYNVEGKLNLATRHINQEMHKYRRLIPFESTLDNYVLKFDLNKFELYFENDNGRKYLRAVGSGANWLNAHLCLFLALADYFYSQRKSTVPTILFIDQPSQVYFPAQKDNREHFDPNEDSLNSPDADLLAVNRVFSLLYDFCIKHSNEIQIIVTDHADDLNVEGLDNFESVVRARWRGDNDGLVDVTKEGIILT